MTFDPYEPRPASANPLVVQCPFCRAAMADPCVIRGTRQRLTQTRAHPSRYDALEEFNRAQANR